MGSERTVARQHTAPERRPAAAAAPVVARVAGATQAQTLQRRLGHHGLAALLAAQSRTERDEDKRARDRAIPAIQCAPLAVSSPSDGPEREATKVGATVARMALPETRAPSPAPPPASPAPASTATASTQVARIEAAPQIQRRHRAGHASLEPHVASDISNRMSGGAPLPPGVRGFMEPRFGADFSGVRIHTDDKAAQLSQQVSAKAFTVGGHVFFGKDAFRPDTPDGRELIAHELTHTIQQGAVVQRTGDPAVQRAEQPTVTAQSPSAVQRLGISDALDYIADKANNIMGFRMFTIVLGVNPINMKPVPRTAVNVMRAVIEFLPGGKHIAEALDNHGILDKVGGWVTAQIETLGMIGRAFKDALMTFLDSLSWTDIFDPWDVWVRAKRIFTDPITRIINFAAGLVSGIIDFIKAAILLPIAKLAEKTPAWDLLCAVLKRNPITGEPVPRTAEKIIPGFLKLIGQEQVWENMQKANAIPRVWAWFEKALSGLVGFVAQIPTVFINAFKSLELVDIVIVPRAFAKVAAVFGGFFLEFFKWAGTMLWTLLEIVIEVVSPTALKYIKRTGAAMKNILKNPLPFMSNLIRAAKRGFQSFADNIGTHLKTGLIDWLTGSLPGVYIPKAFELGELVKFVFSVLGISWQNIRQKLVKAIGETAVKALETGFDIVVTLVTKGPAAAWDKIQEHLTNLKDMVIGGITDFVISTIVKKAVPKLIAMFIPGAGFVSAIISIYDTIMVFVNKISTIIQVVTGFLDSIAAIAAGAIDAAAKKVESILARLLSLAINFLAGFIGLGKVADKIMGVIEKVRGVVDKAIDALINWIVTAAKKLGAFVVAKAKALFDWAFADSTFKDGKGATHKVFINEDGVLTVESTPQAIRGFVTAYVAKQPKKQALGDAVLALVDEAEPIVDKIKKAKTKDPDAVPAPGQQKTLLGISLKISELLAKMLAGDEDIGKTLEKYKLEGVVGTYATTPKPVGDQLTPDHQPQASVLIAAARFFRTKLKIKGGPLAERAENRAHQGYAINLHFNRHVAGATYGSKGWTADDFYKHLIKTVPTDDEDTAKDQVSKQLKGLLAHDVKTVKDVVSDSGHKAWAEIDAIKDEDERKDLKKNIKQQVIAGENQIASQPLDF